MKVKYAILFAALAACSPVVGESVLVHEAPQGTIQIRNVSKGVIKDTFLIATKVVSVEVSGRESPTNDEGAYVFLALDGNQGSNSARYSIRFATREEALAAATLILSKIEKAEQAAP